jgi:hypothetical protein
MDTGTIIFLVIIVIIALVLFELAAQQWTGTFNPRPFDAVGALEIYRAAL